MKANAMKIMGMVVVTVLAGTILTGCPQQLGTFEVWVINTSNNVTVTNVKITNDADTDVTKEFPEDLAVNRGRVIGNIDADPFEGSTVTIEIDGKTGGDFLEDVGTSVTVPTAVSAGDVIVVVVRGNSILDYDSKYVPLEDASKGMLLMRQHVGSLPIGN